jgi:3-oxoacyl-[acyl-carrier protein] reductase
MSDRYSQLVNTPVGRLVSRQVGLPAPVKLERYRPGQPVIDGPVLLGAAAGSSRLADAAAAGLRDVGADLHRALPGGEEQTFKALVFDATGIGSTEELREAWAFFHPTIRRLEGCGRVIVLGTPPDECETPRASIAQWALDGLVRSIGKEVKRGATAQLVYVSPGAEEEIASTLRFLLSPKSAYVSGQMIHVGPAVTEPAGELDWEHPLAGKIALVTGAARGIGEAIATVLARDGAHVVGVDVESQASDLEALAKRIGGSALTADVTAADTPERIASHLLDSHGGVDIVVHNAGVTRDKTLGRMSEDQWSLVLAINITAPQSIDNELFARKAIRDGLLDQRDRRQRRPDQLRDLEGRRDRRRPRVRADAGRTGHDDQRGRPRFHRDGDDGRDADHDPRGRPTDEQPLPGRAAGRRRRDDRLVREPRLGRCQRQRRPRLRPEPDRSMSAVPTRELERSPSMLALFARAGAAMVPGASRLPFVAGGGREATIPALTLSLQDVTVDRDRLVAYDRVCGFSLRDTLPPTYPHMLAFPLHLALLTDGSFPFGAIGLVHISNSIVVHRPIGADERLSIRVWATQLEPHPRGRQFSVRTEVSAGDEVVWEEVSTNLKRGGGGDGARDATPAATADELPTTATWRLPGDLGRRYGAVSGDLNPIHIHPLTARPFGFPTAIAHGMWTKARCLAALESRLPDAYTVEVAFKRPILLPATVVFGEATDDRRILFGVRDAKKGTPHLTGRVSF